jgi:hypothetical protein
MTSFLDHLVGMALGSTPANAARLSLPSRFAQPSATMAVTRDASQAPTEGPVQTLTEDKSHSDRHSGPAPVSFDNSKGIFSTPAVGDEPRETRIGPPMIHASLDDLRYPFASPSSSSTKVAPQPQREPLAAIDSYREHQTIDPKPAISEDFRITEPTPNAPPAAFLISPGTLPIAGLEGPSTPISNAAMAGRTGARDQERPVVHVTIDRLEVRTSSPKPVTKQRHSRPQPAVSLSDYLRGNGSGSGGQG